MKRLLFILAFASLTARSQETGKDLQFDWSYRFYLTQQNQIGDHALAKAYESKIGLGMDLGVLSYQNFNLFGGWQTNYYAVTDKTKVANINGSGFYSCYLGLQYRFDAGTRISVYPSITYGSARLTFREEGAYYDGQSGIQKSAGARIHYNISRKFSVYAAVHYVNYRFDINTNPEYVDYFGKAKQLQTSIGIQIE